MIDTQATFVSEDRLTCKTPPRVMSWPRTARVQLKMNNGLAYVDDESDYSNGLTTFNYVALPSVSHVSPTSVTNSGGNVVKLYGKNLDSVTACRFGARGDYAPVLNRDATSNSYIECVVTKSLDIDHFLALRLVYGRGPPRGRPQ